MKNHYVIENKSFFKKLLNSLLNNFEYASILVEDSKMKKYYVSNSGIDISESSDFTNRGYVIKVYNNGFYSEYSGNQVNDELITKIPEIIKSNLIPIENLIPSKRINKLEDKPNNIFENSNYEIDPEEIGDDVIISKLKSIYNKGKKKENILDFKSFYVYNQSAKMFLSKNRDLYQNIMWSTGGIVALAKKDEIVKDYYQGYSLLGGAELLDDMNKDIDNVCNSVIALLDSTIITPGTYECICSPEVTGMIVHEAFGHGVEMDMFVKDRAIAKDYIGKQVASNLVTMHDGAAAKEIQCASFAFDDDGNPSTDTIIIENGILKSGINDTESALLLHSKNTGNSRRESYKRKAYTRMTNTYFEAGTDKVEDMIKSIKYGFLLENPTCGMEDPKNWGIQCMVNCAKEIKDGKNKRKIFSPIVLSGYVPDLLKSITMMSDKIELSGSGFCGKGHKEWVKVSDGGPYIKATIKLG